MAVSYEGRGELELESERLQRRVCVGPDVKKYSLLPCVVAVLKSTSPSIWL